MSQIAEAQSYIGSACAANAGSVVSVSQRSANTKTKSGFLPNPSAAQALAIVLRHANSGVLAIPTAFMPHDAADEKPDLQCFAMPTRLRFNRENQQPLARKAASLERCEGTLRWAAASRAWKT